MISLLSWSQEQENEILRPVCKGILVERTTYKSKVAGLESNTFDVGEVSGPTKFSKLLKNIKNHIQKTYRSPNNMVKRLHQMKRVGLSCAIKPKKQDPQCCEDDGNPNQDAFNIFPYFCEKKITSQ
jgi:hypothetical protein